MQYTIHTEININAPIGAVWKSFRDFSTHPSWNTFLRIHDTHPKIGDTFKVDFLKDGKANMSMKPTLLKDSPEEAFEWIGHLIIKGIFDGHHQFQFSKLNDTTTRLVQAEHFSGILVPFVKKSVLIPTEKNFIHINETFKNYVESLI